MGIRRSQYEDFDDAMLLYIFKYTEIVRERLLPAHFVRVNSGDDDQYDASLSFPQDGN
ncbi:hypothetical protein ONS96_010078 [Cadophora gregata f. sp. sojae]|nr:hypothetical protein ONS96_010078 [Cadophora gregata f. sp. sojae]